MTDEPERRILSFRPRPADLERVVQKLATEDRHVYVGTHTRERMVERGITRPDVLRVMQRGSISGEITPGKGPGEWKCKVVARLKGSREIGVVTIVVEERRIFVKTVEWEDLS